MQKRLKTGWLVWLCSLCLMSCKPESTVNFHDANAQAISSTVFKGKWVVINYWAAWCESCLREIPELNHFYQHLPNKNILFYGVNYDQLPLTELKAVMNQMNLNFPVLLEDPRDLWHLRGIDFLPMTFIINPEGKVVKKIVGGSTEAMLQNLFNDLQPRP